MKAWILACTCAALLAAGTPVLADGGYRYGGANHGRPPAARHYAKPHHKPHYRPYHRHDHRPHDRPYRYKYRGHDHADEAAFFIGGLLLGNLLAAPEPPVVSYRSQVIERTVIGPAPATSTRDGSFYAEVAPPPEGIRLLRDLDGRCYEIVGGGDGREYRTELPAADCSW
ncbi:MAG TPA: hypothetical protein VIX81_00370 [Gammaproteobacteria bacterium]